jgi:leucyl aminopeptidase
MADSLNAASKAAGEKIWRMPMEASYAEQLKSSVADMKNTGEGSLSPSLAGPSTLGFGFRVRP